MIISENVVLYIIFNYIYLTYLLRYIHWAKKRNAYSISHGVIFKVNKKTYYVKSIKIKNIYQQSQSHKFWNWTHVWESEVLRYVRMVPKMTIPWFVQMLISSVPTVGIKRWLHTARHIVNNVIYCHLRDVVPFLK
jgi:hypothetical protein